MSYFFLSFSLALKQTLSGKKAWLWGLLAALLTAACLIPMKDGAIRAGVYAPEGQGEAFLALLEERSSELIAFIPAGEDEIDRKVLSGEWDCALVLPEDFEQRVAELDTHNLLILKTGPGSTVYPLVRETAAACMMELLSPGIARQYMDKTGMDSAGLEAYLEAIGQSAPRVQVQLRTLQGGELAPLDMTRSQIRRVLTGLTALLALAWGLYLAVDLARWLRGGTAERMKPVCSTTALALPRLAAGMTPVLLWGCSVNLLLGSIGGALAYPAFCLCIAGIALLCARIPGMGTAIPVLTPGLLCASLVLEPVLVEGTALLPGVQRVTRWFPVSLFLQEKGMALLLIGAGLVLLSTLADWVKRRMGRHKCPMS